MTDSNVKFTELTTKKDRVAFIKARLGSDYKWAQRGLTVIYGYQTTAEQEMGSTHEDNGVGFNGVDAEILTSFAEQLEQRGFLTPKQNLILFKKMPKYAGQLERLSAGAK